MIETDTIVACATPPGESALALIRISGPLCRTILPAFFQGPEVVAQPRQATYGRFVDKQGTLIDDGILIFYPAENSFTGEDACELTPHGNPLILKKLLEALLAHGLRLAEPGEFTKRAFLNGRLDLTQAEAVVDVIQARSDAALQAARTQLDGQLGRHLEGIKADLLHAIASLEAYLDFPEEDLPSEDHSGPRQHLAQLQQTVSRLQSTAASKATLQEGYRVVLAGEPNVGKSSLLNALSGEDRALVTPQAGTTRDYLEQFLHWDGLLVRLIDTAGLHESDDSIEEMGMAATEKQLSSAHLIVWVQDASQPKTQEAPPETGKAPVLNAYNKADLLSEENVPRGTSSNNLYVSAETGHGLESLKEEIIKTLHEIPLALADGIAISSRHNAHLEELKASLTEAQSQLDSADLDLAATALHNGKRALAEIIGEIDHEEVLDRLFGEFCIGK